MWKIQVIHVCVCVSPTDDDALKLGDVLLQVQDVSLQDMTRFEAWNLIKSLPEGPVSVVIRRKTGAAEWPPTMLKVTKHGFHVKGFVPLSLTLWLVFFLFFEPT